MSSVCPYAHAAVVQPDPCADYLALKEAPPVHWDEVLGIWFITGTEQVGELIRHPALSSAWPERGRTVLHDPADEVNSHGRTADSVRRWFMFDDGTRHRALRGLVAPLFSAGRLALLRPFVEEQADDLLARRHGRIEVMADLAVPLSSRVICRVLGLPSDTAPRLEGWAQDIAALLVADYLPEVSRRGDLALSQIEHAVATALESPDLPPDSGLAVLRKARESGEAEEADISAVAGLIVYAGFETTSTFIGKAVRSVLHAGAWRELRSADPAVAVEELLRFDTSVRQVARVATAPVTLEGQRIEAGDLVLLMLGAANRDPGVFTDPDTLRLDRRIKKHLAFGQGQHYCLGAGLARMEARIVIEKISRAWRDVRLVEPPTTKLHFGIPVLERLELELS
ncbi:cytochrome P-450 like protein [Streptomyces griseomycini]|uniref:cytochrome P450 n=1 Tax=Streptomyces griseomycini TaxID=66895 RepID=UPI0018736FA6|nr:cytochrome P450 [Streptomyces griseomycini]GGQ08037.1 cytochrome P-450 like protein [Streptomyces griseomycini]